MSPATALLLAGAAEHHEGPGRVRTASHVAVRPSYALASAFRRAGSSWEEAFRDFAHRCKHGTHNWNMAAVLHYCPFACGMLGNAANHIFGRRAPDPPKPSRGRERPTVRPAGTACTDMPQMRLAASKPPRDVSPTTPVMRPRRSRDLPRAIPPPHVLRGGETEWVTYASPSSPGRVVAHRCLLICVVLLIQFHRLPPSNPSR